MRRLSEQFITAGFVLAILVLGGIGSISYWSMKTLLDNQRWVEHTEQVLDALDDVLDGLGNIENERTAYLLSRKKPPVIEEFPGIQATKTAVQSVRQLTSDNLAQQRRLDELEPLLAQQLTLLQNSVRLQPDPDAATQATLNQQAKALKKEIKSRLAEMEQEERILLQKRTARAEISIQYAFLALSVGYGLGFSLLFIVFLLLKKQIQERQRSQAALKILNEQLESQIQERTAELTHTNGLLRAEVIERKQAEQALKRAKDDLEVRVQERTQELQRSNQELEQFAYIASHDLQEPLRAIANYTQMLARKYEGNLDEKANKYIFYVVDGATRMQQLINDLLKYSRTGRQSLDFKPVDCNVVLQQVLSHLQMAVPQNAEITSDPLPTVVADSLQLHQLFQNLIGNALKYCSDAPPKIHISASQRNREWVFSVQDNGIGIDPQYQEQIFIIFRRLHTRRDYPGTGIGLSVCKKIVERHHGQIWLESQLGKGSTFYFTLPIENDQLDEEDSTTQPVESHEASAD